MTAGNEDDPSAPGFNTPAPTTPSREMSLEEIDRQLREEELTNSKNWRLWRQSLFGIFGAICALQLFGFPLGIGYFIYSDNYLSLLNAPNSRAAIAVSILVAVACTVPLTIFITLAHIIRNSEKTEKATIDDDSLNISSPLTTLVKCFCDFLKSRGNS